MGGGKISLKFFCVLNGGVFPKSCPETSAYQIYHKNSKSCSWCHSLLFGIFSLPYCYQSLYVHVHAEYLIEKLSQLSCTKRDLTITLLSGCNSFSFSISQISDLDDVRVTKASLSHVISRCWSYKSDQLWIIFDFRQHDIWDRRHQLMSDLCDSTWATVTGSSLSTFTSYSLQTQLISMTCTS